MRKFNEIDPDELRIILNNNSDNVEMIAKNFCEFMRIPFYYYGEYIISGKNNGMENWELVAMVYDKFIEGSTTNCIASN